MCFLVEVTQTIWDPTDSEQPGFLGKYWELTFHLYPSWKPLENTGSGRLSRAEASFGKCCWSNHTSPWVRSPPLYKWAESWVEPLLKNHNRDSTFVTNCELDGVTTLPRQPMAWRRFQDNCSSRDWEKALHISRSMSVNLINRLSISGAFTNRLVTSVP